MKEINISLKYISLFLKDVGRHNFTVHFATGSKLDGNSATLAMTLACLSSYFDIPLDNSYTITGALDLRGNVRPIGGIVAKATGTLRWGYKGIIYPIDNHQQILVLDEEEFLYNPEEPSKLIEFSFNPVYTILDAIDLVFPKCAKRDKMIELVTPFVRPIFIDKEVPSKRLR